MAFIDPFNDDLDRSVRLRFERNLAPTFLPLLNWLANQIFSAAELRELQRRTLDQILHSLRCLVGNLAYAAEIDRRCFVAISLRPDAFRQTQYNRSGIGYRNFDRVVELMRDAREPYITYARGFRDARRGVLRSTRLRATDRLLQIVSGFGALVRRGNDINADNIDAIVNEILAADPVPPFQMRYEEIVDHGNPEIIILRDANGDHVEYEDTAEVTAMRGRLAAWNSFAKENFHIDILLSDNDLRDVFRNNRNEELFDNDDDPAVVELRRTRLYRVFNNSDFQQGGRFYGGWWQSIPSALRPRITINESATAEFDYSSLHPAMLYAQAGAVFPADPYTLEGVHPAYRKLIKRTFNSLINARPGQPLRPPQRDQLPVGWTWRQLQDAIVARHGIIADQFRSGAGLRLQKLDSDIAEQVMMRMQARGVLVLPIHDSFLTYAGLRNDLRDEMLLAYREIINADIGMRGQPVLEEQFEVEGAPAEEQLANHDIIDGLRQGPGYEGYRNRWEEFESTRTDEWHRRFGGRWIERPGGP